MCEVFSFFEFKVRTWSFFIKDIFILWRYVNQWVFGLCGSQPPVLISSRRPPAPKKFSTSSTSSYLKSSLYDHGLWVYGLFEPIWPTHTTWICFKETTLLFNVHLNCLVNFFLCPTDKYMFKVNKLVFGNFGSSIYWQNGQFRKSYLFFRRYVLLNKVLHVIHL